MSAAIAREIDVRRAAVGGAFASALVGLFALATSGPVGPLPIVVLVGAIAVGALRLRRTGVRVVEARNTWRTGLVTFLLALVIVPVHATLSGSWLLGAVDLLVLLQANRLLAMREGEATGQVLLVSLLMLLAAAVLTIRLEFLAAVFLFCLAGTWTAIFRELSSPDATGADAKVPVRVAWVAAFGGIGVFAATCLLFAVLPRLQLSAFDSGVLQTEGVSGFSDEVQLGDIGSVKQDHRPVMRITVKSGPPVDEGSLYWRGIALDHYDAGRWKVIDAGEDRVGGGRGFSMERETARLASFRVGDEPADRVPVVQDVVLEPLDVSVLFGLPSIGVVRADLPFVSVNLTDSIFFRAKDFGRMHYRVESYPVNDDAEVLLTRAAVAPPEKDPETPADRYLQVPPDVKAKIASLAAELAGDGPAFRKARRIESAMQSWEYSLAPPKGSEHDPVVSFLTETRAGWCESYASGMVLMLRSIGIPARMANGFHGGERNDFGGYWLVRRSDAHSWVEVPFEGVGWVTFDPTPGGGGREEGMFDGLFRGWDYLRTFWTQRVVEYDILDQFRFLKAAGSAAEGFGAKLAATISGARPGRRSLLVVLALSAGGAGVALSIVALRRRRAAGDGNRIARDAAEAERWWKEVERRWRRDGVVRGAGETPRELARRAGRPEWADVYYVARFADRPLDDVERARIDRIREELSTNALRRSG